MSPRSVKEFGLHFFGDGLACEQVLGQILRRSGDENGGAVREQGDGYAYLPRGTWLSATWFVFATKMRRLLEERDREQAQKEANALIITQCRDEIAEQTRTADLWETEIRKLSGMLARQRFLRCGIGVVTAFTESMSPPAGLRPVDEAIAKAQGSSVALDATPESLEAGKTWPTPSLKEIIEDRTREVGRLREELAYLKEVEQLGDYLRQELEYVMGRLGLALRSFRKEQQDIKRARNRH
ncbi:hypothetical protein GGR55DRAFT_679300 [Xylaria sp. FL0064]|nr:hypothetical protein GGR55DRAFT_679300 [Xylaria sp. FL0064]